MNNKEVNEVTNSLLRQIEDFFREVGETPEDFLARWRSGELPDTAENASRSIRAQGLCQAEDNFLSKIKKNPKYAGPGDGGPCPECGKDMAAKAYKGKDLRGVERESRGRYWHMRHEHGIMEDYVSPGSRDDYWIEDPDA